MASKKKKIRAEFKKNRNPRARPTDWTRQFASNDFDEDKVARDERISGKGELTRRRVVIGQDASGEDNLLVLRDVDRATCLNGRVLSVHGLSSTVVGDDGADIEAHRPHEGEFRVDHPRVLRRQHDGARVKVAVQHGFGG